MLPSYLSFLNENDLQQLKDASLSLLENVGMKIEDEEVRKKLASFGCIIKSDRVLFPRDFIDVVTADAQSNIPFKRNNFSFNLEQGFPRTHSTGGTPWVVDPDGKRRNALSEDMIDSLKLMNSLENLDLPCCLFYPSDVPSEISQLAQTEAMFRYSKKPIYAPGLSVPENAKYVAELYKIFANDDGTYPCMTGVSPESPLYLPKEITDILTTVISAGIPVSMLAAPMAGLTGPITLTGSVAQCYAELLATAAFCWTVNPKTPLIMGCRTFFCNMNLAQTILGLPETGIASAICSKLAARDGYLSDVYGLSCTAIHADEQAGFEKMFNALVPALGGTALITGYGSLASVMCGSLGQLLIDDEIFAMIRRCFKEFAVDEDYLGLEAIQNVALDDSTFLVEDHTIEHLRDDDIFTGKLGFNRMPEEKDPVESTLFTRAAEKARQIIDADEITPLPEEVEREMAIIMDAARKELL